MEMVCELSVRAQADQRDYKGFSRRQNVGGCGTTLTEEHAVMVGMAEHAPEDLYRARLCVSIFLALCHADTPWGRACDRLRQRCRCATRRRAMGVSGITVDIDLGLHHLLTAIDFASIRDVLLQAMPELDAQSWHLAQMLRAIFRWGLLRRWWPRGVERWPMCYFGMLTAALYCTGQYLTRAQRRTMRQAFDGGCSRITQWVSSVLAGSGDAGTITICDTHHDYVVPYTGIVAQSDVGRLCAQSGCCDLHSQLTAITRGAAWGRVLEVGTEAAGDLVLVPAASCADEDEPWAASLQRTCLMVEAWRLTGHALMGGARGVRITADGRVCVDRMDAVVTMLPFAVLPDEVPRPADACEHCGAAVQCGCRFCTTCATAVARVAEQRVAEAGDAAEAEVRMQVSARSVEQPAVSAGVPLLARLLAASAARGAQR